MKSIEIPQEIPAQGCHIWFYRVIISELWKLFLKIGEKICKILEII